MKEHYTPWLISGVVFLYAIGKDVYHALAGRGNRRAELDAATERRLQALEVGRQLDQAALNGELRLINQRVGHALGAVQETRHLLKTALTDE